MGSDKFYLIFLHSSNIFTNFAVTKATFKHSQNEKFRLVKSVIRL